MDLPVNKIIRRSDARAVDQATVDALSDSIAQVGLINPIRVRATGSGWEVIAGAHRLEACKALGLVDVACHVVEDSDLLAELAMIDENLCRAELSPSDRARQTARRKAIYLELHPETGHGGDRSKSQTLRLDDAERFTADTAKVAGSSERIVQLNAERGEKVIDEVHDLIRGTKLDTGKFLDRVKKLSPNDQVAVAKRELAFLKASDRDAEKAARQHKIAADISVHAGIRIAEILAERHPEEWDAIANDLSVTKLKDILTGFANLTRQRVMDRSAA